MSTFGPLLRELREQRGMSMGELARRLGVAVPYLSGVELERKSPLTTERIEEVAHELALSPKETERLLETAAETRGVFQLDTSKLGPTGMAVGAALARCLHDLDEAQLEEIRKIIERNEKLML